MKGLFPKQHIWRREVDLATNSEVWRVFAVETKCCAEFLLSKYEVAMREQEQIKGFFADKYVRMLWGFALENLAKGILLSGPSKHEFLKANRITFGKKGHDLEWLILRAGTEISDEALQFVRGWAVSAEWSGKYPFPVEMNRVLAERVPARSSKALFRKVLRKKRPYLQNDLLHTGIGASERQAFDLLFSNLTEAY